MERDSWEWNWFGFLRRGGRGSSFTGIKPWLPTTGWLAHYSRPAMPAASQAHLLRSTSANAATGGTTTLMHNSCPAPTCSTSSLVQHHQNCHSQAVTLHLWVRWGGVAAPKEHPWLAGGTFCKHANLALCHPASNGGATLLPSASSWQCISNANFREAHAKERLDLPRREAEGGQVAVMGKERTNVTLSRHIFYHNKPESWDIDVPGAVRPTDCFGLSWWSFDQAFGWSCCGALAKLKC